MIGISERLRHARMTAGFETATAAAARFGWTASTYARHENGSRGVKDPALTAYASAFGVTKQWLRYGTGSGPREQPPVLATQAGFADGDVQAFSPATDRSRTALENLVRQIAPAARNISLYQASRAYLDLAVLAGDVLAIDQKDRPRPGDAVIINVADENTGSARTAIRRYAPPLLLAGFGEAFEDLTDGNVAVLGRIVATVRPQEGWDRG